MLAGGVTIGYRLDEARRVCDVHDVPVGIIPAVDYGMVNGPKVLDLALDLIEKSHAQTA